MGRSGLDDDIDEELAARIRAARMGASSPIAWELARLGDLTCALRGGTTGRRVQFRRL